MMERGPGRGRLVSIKRWTLRMTLKLDSIRSSRRFSGSAGLPRAASSETSARWRTINSSERPMQELERATSSSFVMATCLHVTPDLQPPPTVRALLVHRIVLRRWRPGRCRGRFVLGAQLLHPSAQLRIAQAGSFATDATERPLRCQRQIVRWPLILVSRAARSCVICGPHHAGLCCCIIAGAHLHASCGVGAGQSGAVEQMAPRSPATRDSICLMIEFGSAGEGAAAGFLCAGDLAGKSFSARRDRTADAGRSTGAGHCAIHARNRSRTAPARSVQSGRGATEICRLLGRLARQ